MDVKNTSHTGIVDGGAITINTAKIDFKRGEEVKIQIVNSGTIPIIFADSSLGIKITGLAGIPLYTPVRLDDKIVLGPGEEIDFLWDQIKNDGDTVLEGLYKIFAHGTDNNGKIIETSTTITIRK